MTESEKGSRTEVSKEYFDQIAKDYDTSFDGKYVRSMYPELVERIRKEKPKTVLDLGCGNGNVLAELMSDNKIKLFGADLSSQMVEEAMKRVPTGTFCVANAEDLPYEDNSFDVIVCNASFHHYTNPIRVVEEMKRVLKKNGTLILGDPTAPFSLYLKFLNWTLRWMKSGDFHIYDKKEITTLLSSKGFKVSGFKKISSRNFVLNASL
ncbi:MAG: methyltransferase domain-containing protein [bacterium]|nr:methyltransferase domain-containing protein [bacterium]